jgi:hypothetical protein
VFDDTPLRVLSVVGGVCAQPIHRTSGPIFDRTPLHQNNPDGGRSDAPSHTDDECTPVLQDTPSQYVDGTKEVTQEHNIQAQLDKCNKEQAAKLAEHSEKLLKYYRKYPSRKKIADCGPSDVPAKSSKELSTSGSLKRKKRTSVTKISFLRT